MSRSEGGESCGFISNFLLVFYLLKYEECFHDDIQNKSNRGCSEHESTSACPVRTNRTLITKIPQRKSTHSFTNITDAPDATLISFTTFK